jgi:hypothetical protein
MCYYVTDPQGNHLYGPFSLLEAMEKLRRQGFNHEVRNSDDLIMAVGWDDSESAGRMRAVGRHNAKRKRELNPRRAFQQASRRHFKNLEGIRNRKRRQLQRQEATYWKERIPEDL